jgi:DNA polymerase-3 subunit epsilon
MVKAIRNKFNWVVSLNFTAIDFETANGSPASPCAVGLVRVRDGQVVESFATVCAPPYPNDWFHAGNIRVHGIHPADVADGPYWHEVLPLLLDFVGDDVLIAHNAPFDMGVLRASSELIGVEVPELYYACTVNMSRKTYNLESYRLNAVAYRIGIEEFNHHDALADADTCARIVLHMAKTHGVDTLDELLAATKQALKPLRKPAQTEEV